MHPKSFITLDQSDHLMTNERESRYAGNMVASCDSRYVEGKFDELKPTSYEPGAVVARCRTKDVAVLALVLAYFVRPQ